MWRVAATMLVARWAFCFAAAESSPPGTTLESAVPPALETSEQIERSDSAPEKPPYRIPENRIMEFLVPLSRESKIAIANTKNPPVEYARAAIAVPARFEPGLTTPILVISGSSDGDGSSVRAMRSFTNVALRLGWMVIAADGSLGKPPNDNPGWRWAMTSAVLDHLHKTWPASRNWPIAAAGVSGGGKWSGVMGAVLANKGYNLVGVFMGAVNEDYASEAAKLYEPAVRFKKTPIFISSGTDDKIATPEHHGQVKENLQHHGFGFVRLSTFDGGHALSENELRKALNWFVERYAGIDTDER